MLDCFELVNVINSTVYIRLSLQCLSKKTKMPEPPWKWSTLEDSNIRKQKITSNSRRYFCPKFLLDPEVSILLFRVKAFLVFLVDYNNLALAKSNTKCLLSLSSSKSRVSSTTNFWPISFTKSMKSQVPDNYLQIPCQITKNQCRN